MAFAVGGVAMPLAPQSALPDLCLWGAHSRLLRRATRAIAFGGHEWQVVSYWLVTAGDHAKRQDATRHGATE